MRFRLFFLYRWGQEPVLILLAQMGPRFLAILGVRQRVGSELQCTGANMAAGGQVAVRGRKHGP